MDSEPQLLYLEPDDEITSVIRRLRGADAGRVVLVAPGRSRATSSVVALRLLARAAHDAGRSVALVADASTRALAGEAGVAAFASVAEATSPTPAPPASITPTRAPIHVVRGTAGAAARPPVALPPTDGLDETMAVHLPPPAAASGSRRTRLRSFPAWPWLAALLVVAVAVGAALLPAATVRITRATVDIDPIAYPIRVGIAGTLSDELQSTKPGTATGVRLEQVAATGGVTFINWSLVTVAVPEGTQVSVGGTVAFSTVKRIVVPRGRFNGQVIQPGREDVAVVAITLGISGNVAAEAIDTVDDATVRAFLRGSPDNPNRLVINDEATGGGLDTPHPVIAQTDVDAVVAAIKADLQQQLADALGGEPDRLYSGPSADEAPSLEVPDDLVGKEDVPTFELSGTLIFDRPYASRAEVEAAARSSLLADPNAAPDGMSVVQASISVELGEAVVTGDELLVNAAVTAAAAADIDDVAVRDRVAGLTIDEARTALAELGEIDVDLWPSWQDRIPRLAFRISVETVAPSPGESPRGSAE
ncbi:MAG: hypothetical protein WED86_01260 [Chloroflexota bacterium]